MACRQVKCRCGATVTQNSAGQLLAHTTPYTYGFIRGNVYNYDRKTGEPCQYATKGARAV